MRSNSCPDWPSQTLHSYHVLPSICLSNRGAPPTPLADDRSCGRTRLALDTMLTAGELPDLAALRERFGPAAATPPAVSVALPAIVTYDALLGAEPVGAAA